MYAFKNKLEKNGINVAIRRKWAEILTMSVTVRNKYGGC